MNEVRQLIARSSIPGLSTIAQTKTKFRLTLWCLATASVFFFSAHDIAYLFVDFIRYPVITTVRIENARHLEFPAITVCNGNLVRRDRLCNLSSHLEEYDELIYPLFCQPSVKAVDHLIERLSRKWKKHRNDSVNTISSMHFGQIIQEVLAEILADLLSSNETLAMKMGHQFRDFLVHCSRVTTGCSKEDFKEFQDAATGNCFTYDYQSHGYESSQIGFTGPTFGVSMILNLELDKYLWSTQEAVAKVIIHRPDTPPNPDMAIMVLPKLTTYIGIGLIEVDRKPPPYVDQCNNNWSSFHVAVWGDTVLRENYSKESCMKICLQFHIMQRCNCQAVFLPIMVSADKIPICRWFDVKDSFFCVLDVRNEFLKKELECDCHLPCKEFIYQKTISMAHWRSGHIKAAASGLNHSTLIESHLSKIVVYFESSSHMDITHGEKYTVPNLKSSIGGILGMYAGISILILFELFEMFWRAISVAFSKRKKFTVADRDIHSSLETVQTPTSLEKITVLN